MGKFLDFFIEKEVDPYMEAYNAEKAGDFTKAAEIYDEMAETEATNNVYSFARYRGLAAMAFLKVQNHESAKAQLNDLLETFNISKNLSQENFSPQYLLKIVWDLDEAGFTNEAEIFLTQINQKLVENSCPFKIEFIPSKPIKAECPNCQAMIQIVLDKNVKCPYCDSLLAEH